MKSSALIMPFMLLGCAPEVPTAERLTPEYRGIETRLLDNDLVEFEVEMVNALTRQDVKDYGACAAAGYTLIRGWSFARHLRTIVTQEAGIWRGNAVYTISRDLPRGIVKLDAEVVSADCDARGIPTV